MRNTPKPGHTLFNTKTPNENSPEKIAEKVSKKMKKFTLKWEKTVEARFERLDKRCGSRS